MYVKCLECAINPLIHTFRGGASVSSSLLPLVCVKWRVFSKQQLILTLFKRPGNLKGVAGFKKQTELYSYKCRSKSSTSSTFTSNGLSNSNVKVLTICLGLWCLLFIMRQLLIKLWSGNRNETLLRYLLTSFYLQPSSVPYLGTQKKLRTAKATFLMSWLYCGAYHPEAW